MNLHQFRFVQEAVRRGLNLTDTANALHTPQPGVGTAILALEEELGIDVFARHGKRLRRVTEPGAQVLKSIEIILREVGNLKRIGEEFSKQDAGHLSIATTHTQARYVLPEPVALATSTRPCGSFVRASSVGERPSSANWGGFVGSARTVTAVRPRSRGTLTRKRPPAPRRIDASAKPCARK